MGCGAKPAIIQMQDPQELPEVTPAEVTTDEMTEPIVIPATIFVHVCGAVKQAGVYEMLEGNRIFEAIELAGGFAEEAHPQAVNLADKVTDGLQIFVPTKEEASNLPNLIPNQTTSAEAQESLVNINIADATKLQELSGIGVAKANAILSYREQHGAFNSIEDIKKVSGIGEKLYEGIKENITVD